MTLQARVQLIDFQKTFNANIDREIRLRIDGIMPKVVTKIKQRLQAELVRLITTSPEYQSIQSGQLRAELGLRDPTVLDGIVQVWAEGVEVVYNKNEGKFGVIAIRMIRSDYSDVLSLPEASYFYATNQGSGVIEWLRWLLLEGNSIIVFDYDFQASNKGRTGLGIMVQKTAGGWQVPIQFSGTSANNFVTRALSSMETAIDNVVRQEITKGLLQ